MLARFPFECDSVKLKTYCDVAASICLVLTVQTTKIKLEALGLEYVFLLIWLHSIKIIIMRKRALPRRPSSVPGIFRREGTKECRQCTAAPISVRQKEIGGKKKKATSCKPIWKGLATLIASVELQKSCQVGVLPDTRKCYNSDQITCANGY